MQGNGFFDDLKLAAGGLLVAGLAIGGAIGALVAFFLARR